MKFYLIEKSSQQEIGITEFNSEKELHGHLSQARYDRKSSTHHVGYVDKDTIMVVYGKPIPLTKRSVLVLDKEIEK